MYNPENPAPTITASRVAVVGSAAVIVPPINGAAITTVGRRTSQDFPAADRTPGTKRCRSPGQEAGWAMPPPTSSPTCPAPELAVAALEHAPPADPDGAPSGSCAGMIAVMVVDVANVIGSRPTGWWRDRPGAARRFVQQVRAAVREGRMAAPGGPVLEGQGRGGAAEATADGVEVVHAPGSGDDTIVSVATDRSDVVAVTADRALIERLRAVGAEVRGPGWFQDQLDA